jgi:predicted XRE-type DNA-binding protein
VIEHVTPADGNIFEDIGFPPHEAKVLQLRSELMSKLHGAITARRLTQARAARLFGVSQPRISDLVRGKIDRFSVDTLIEMLHRAGAEVDITVRAA